MKRIFSLLLAFGISVLSCADYGKYYFIRLQDPFTNQVSAYTVDDYLPEAIPEAMRTRPEGIRIITRLLSLIRPFQVHVG